mmetsp:Transcript_24800/g.38593  ORF Transcript_24800/g.38593 Transcript_24800/m.38593 type:complete len:159 (-) Transcript_24800:708-1184(-)
MVKDSYLEQLNEVSQRKESANERPFMNLTASESYYNIKKHKKKTYCCLVLSLLVGISCVLFSVGNWYLEIVYSRYFKIYKSNDIEEDDSTSSSDLSSDLTDPSDPSSSDYIPRRGTIYLVALVLSAVFSMLTLERIVRRFNSLDPIEVDDDTTEEDES